MLNKRLNVFETNSSSVHSITLNGTNVNDLVVEKDGYIHISLQYYGKNKESYANSYDKLCYLLLVACYSNRVYIPYVYSDDPTEEDMEDWRNCCEDLRDTQDYKDIEECVVTELNKQDRICYGFKLHMSDCGIDHQSTDFESLSEFLEENNVKDIHEFIFGRAVLHTDID